MSFTTNLIGLQSINPERARTCLATDRMPYEKVCLFRGFVRTFQDDLSGALFDIFLRELRRGIKSDVREIIPELIRIILFRVASPFQQQDPVQANFDRSVSCAECVELGGEEDYDRYDNSEFDTSRSHAGTLEFALEQIDGRRIALRKRKVNSNAYVGKNEECPISVIN